MSDTPRTDEACEVPLIEQLRSVPKDFVADYPTQWSEDGRETGHRHAPVGRMMHRAADTLARYEIAEKELPGEPNYLRVRNGFTIGAYGNQEPTYGEYVTRSDYDALRAHAAKVTAERGGYAERLERLANAAAEANAHMRSSRGMLFPSDALDRAEMLAELEAAISHAAIKPTEFAAAQVSASGDPGLTGSEPAPSAGTEEG